MVRSVVKEVVGSAQGKQTVDATNTAAPQVTFSSHSTRLWLMGIHSRLERETWQAEHGQKHVHIIS
jgi:hypothetical protein